jgi:hypothetical protein
MAEIEDAIRDVRKSSFHDKMLSLQCDDFRSVLKCEKCKMEENNKND